MDAAVLLQHILISLTYVHERRLTGDEYPLKGDDPRISKECVRSGAIICLGRHDSGSLAPK